MATIDYNSLGAAGTAGEITTATESILTLYNIPDSPGHKRYRVGIEISPDLGTTWFKLPGAFSQRGFLTVKVAATKARIKVYNKQGGTSAGNVFLVAR